MPILHCCFWMVHCLLLYSALYSVLLSKQEETRYTLYEFRKNLVSGIVCLVVIMKKPSLKPHLKNQTTIETNKESLPKSC